VRFKEFHEVDICNPEAILTIASFFVQNNAVCLNIYRVFYYQWGIHMTAITHVGLAVPDLDAAIKWYEQVLGFRLLSGPYSFDASEENEHKMTNDLLDDHIKKMRNAHLMADNSVGI
jgi:hypothetical protein